MDNKALIDCWNRMDHSRERLAVLPDQLVQFVHDLPWEGKPAHLDIECPDEGAFYIKARG